MTDDIGDPRDLAGLIDRWNAGWVKSRRVPPADRIHGAFRVSVGQPERRFEFVVVSPDAASDTIAPIAHLAEETPGRNWVSVFTRSPDAAADVLRGAGLTVDGDVESLMTIQLGEQRLYETPEPYRLEVRSEGDVAAVSITARNGAIAATGQVAFSGTDAIPDRIVTGLDHRRRGLGAGMMSAIVTEALRRGATSGILTASVEGEKLYSRLGWESVARLVIGRTA